jgi:membrane protein YqaA with SNARE-associated domain
MRLPTRTPSQTSAFFAALVAALIGTGALAGEIIGMPPGRRRPRRVDQREHPRLRRQWNWVKRQSVIVKIILALFLLAWMVVVFFVTCLVAGAALGST